MKTKVLAIALFASFALLSCKGDKETPATEGTETAPAAKERFSVDIDVTAEKDDNFSVFYTEDNTIAFTADKAVWSGVKGGKSDHIVFDLPEEVIPTDIRIDFGMNKEQGNVTLEKFKFMYFGKSFEARGSDFHKYFIPNDSIKTQVDEAKGTITFLKGAKFSPAFYYPQQAVLDEIAKITK